ncbi:hypothetical protein ACXWRS_12335, partial [Streptococcus pyogenes]
SAALSLFAKQSGFLPSPPVFPVLFLFFSPLLFPSFPSPPSLPPSFSSFPPFSFSLFPPSFFSFFSPSSFLLSPFPSP